MALCTFTEAGNFVSNVNGTEQKRSMMKDSARGKWVSSCSGHVDSGEDYDSAAVRELGEELGLFEPEGFARVFKELPCDQTGQEFVWVYHCKSEGPFTLDPEESSEGRWIAVSELDQWIRSSPRVPPETRRHRVLADCLGSLEPALDFIAVAA